MRNVSFPRVFPMGILTGMLLIALMLASPSTGNAAELTAAIVADPKGDGPDGKGNTSDDTWQFWLQLVGGQKYHRLGLATSTMTDEQRKSGIRDEKARRGKQKVRGPIGSMLPNPGDTEGWIFHTDWDGRFEGAWGDKKANQVIMHPYTEKTDACAVAVTYTAPADGKYVVSGKVTDVQVSKAEIPNLDGITYWIDVVEPGEKETTTTNKPLKQGKVGDNVGPESEEFHLDGVDLKKGQLLRLRIDPNKFWGGDMTRVELKIEPAK